MVEDVSPAPADLDAVLALQLAVAWAGEGLCRPARLGWWQTDLVDEGGGGYLFRQLLPQTHAWATLEAVRATARRLDRQARERMAEPERMRTLFFWGFRIDEKLDERLAGHKRDGSTPHETLALLGELPSFALDAPFDRDAFETFLTSGAPAVKTRVVPGGRQLVGEIPDALALRARRLAAALLPLAEHYPAPFFVEAGSG